jgi:hypothetical protein
MPSYFFFVNDAFQSRVVKRNNLRGFMYGEAAVREAMGMVSLRSTLCELRKSLCRAAMKSLSSLHRQTPA